MTLSHDIAVSPAEPIAGKSRFHLVDIVKGLAIALVVYGHSAQGMEHRGWWHSPTYFFLDSYIYSFHMPAFFFVAGLFLLGSLNRRGWEQFVLEKLKTILYPYVLWASIGFVTMPLLFLWIYPGAKHAAFSKFLLDLLDGNADWFLLTLFVCLMLAALTRKMPHWLCFVLAFAVAVFTPYSTIAIRYYLPHMFCFLAAGMWVGSSIRRIEELKPAMATIGFCVVMGVQALVVHRYGFPGTYADIPLGFAGTLGLFLLARAIESTPAGKFFVWAGQASLAIFLISPYSQDAVREPLSRLLHVQSFWPQLLLPTLITFFVPAVLWHRQKEWKLSWLFRWP